MQDLTNRQTDKPINRQTDTRTNYRMPTVHRAPRHNDIHFILRPGKESHSKSSTHLDSPLRGTWWLLPGSQSSGRWPQWIHYSRPHEVPTAHQCGERSDHQLWQKHQTLISLLSQLSTYLYLPNLQHSFKRKGFHAPQLPNPIGLTRTTSLRVREGSILLHNSSTRGSQMDNTRSLLR